MIGFFVFACAIAIVLPFFAYPALLWLRASLSPCAIASAEIEPRVDLLIAAHNEIDSIEARLENALALDYPKGRLTIWVASDGSSDGTVEAARRFESRGVRVLALPRGGKAAALVAMVEASDAEVLALTDANSDWERGALRALVRPFADPQVGGVAGDQCYVPAESDADGTAGERSYWSFDRLLKRWQSQAGNAISATGAIYAIRRDCFETPPPDATDDFMISTGVIAKGLRLVFSEEARAFEPPAEPNAGEFRRKVRITTRGLRAVWHRRALLNPRRTGLYAIELAVHKLWRRLTWIPLAGLVLLTPAALLTGPILGAMTVAASGLVLAGVLAELRPSLARLRPFAIARYVVMVNAACALATWNSIRGHRVARWDTERASSDAPTVERAS